LGVEFKRSISRARPPVMLMGGLNLVRALGLGGVPVVLATGDRQALSLASRYCCGRLPLPTADGTDAVLKALMDAGGQLARSWGGRVPLFYSNDDQLALVQQHRHLLEEHYLLLLNDPGVDHALLDKALFEKLARERGLPVPRALRWDGIGGDSLADFAEPVIVKPHMRKLRGEFKLFDELLSENDKARVFASGGEAMAHPLVQQLHPHLAFQEYVHGSGRDIWSYHGVADEKARLLGSFCGRKIRSYPALTGMSSFLELVHDGELETLGRWIAGRVPLKGVFKMDFKRDSRNGRLFILEINARFNLWHYLGAKSGVNLPLIAYEYLLYGNRPQASAYRTRHRWLYWRMDRRAFRELSARGELTLVAWIASLVARPVVCEIFAWGDPLPFILDLGRRLAARLARYRSALLARLPAAAR
jgi:D-aspartate ligase